MLSNVGNIVWLTDPGDYEAEIAEVSGFTDRKGHTRMYVELRIGVNPERYGAILGITNWKPLMRDAALGKLDELVSACGLNPLTVREEDLKGREVLVEVREKKTKSGLTFPDHTFKPAPSGIKGFSAEGPLIIDDPVGRFAPATAECSGCDGKGHYTDISAPGWPSVECEECGGTGEA